MKPSFFSCMDRAARRLLVVTAVMMLCGCGTVPPASRTASEDPNQAPASRSDQVASAEQKVFDLQEITPQQGQAYLLLLGIGTTSAVPGHSAVAVSGSADDLYKAGVLLDLVDTKEAFLVETLAPLSKARTVPTNAQIAAALGRVAVGTFAHPPQRGEPTRAIIDIHRQSVVAIIPARIRKQLLDLVASGAIGPRPTTQARETAKPQEVAPAPSLDTVSTLCTWLTAEWKHAYAGAGVASAPVPTPETSPAKSSVIEPGKEPRQAQGKVVSEPVAQTAGTKNSYEITPPANGDDVLRVDLPEQMEVSRLLDLVAEYLHIDYMYDPEKIRGQSVSLRLHGKLQGEIRVKDLYPLLESVLKFKGFAMTCHKGNVVTIVPMTDALQADPMLVDPNKTGLEAGDMVVTRVFKLQYVSAGNAVKLLDGLKLSAATLPIEETGSLIVTCYAHRMARIERLLDMVDQPGRPKEFRYRQLTHTTAAALRRKVEAIVGEMQSTTVRISPAEQALLAIHPPPRPSFGPRKPGESIFPDAVDRRTVYLDADEGTNRLLMVGYPEQLAIVEGIVTALDVEQQDLRTFKVYEVKNVDAEEAKKQLAAFKLVGDEDPRAGTSVLKKTQPVVAGPPVVPPVGAGNEDKSLNAAERDKDSSAATEGPQVSVLPSSNSLLINATPAQHGRIACVIGYVDTMARQGAIPCEVYSLENQEPEHLAEVLQKLLKETVVNKEGKIEKEIRRIEEEIVIVPDKSTFSLIVYANKKNQDWIGKLVKTLDKRRPQVLIDATLVEITKTDAFTYDLNLLGSLPSVASTAAVSGASAPAVGKLLQSEGGAFSAFYGDEHIQALLQAMQSKNYGRVLAKPKILVNDNEPGKIKTSDVTYVETTSSIPVISGTAGSQTNLVQTAVKYDPYEAGITLDITPHISEGELLRLDIALTRSDFLETSDTKKPPNKRSNEVNTKVTVPDGSTIILGGLLKLNQNKGGKKVPILGDIPFLGGLFRSVNNKDTQDKLYVFVKAEIIRPSEPAGRGLDELSKTSEKNRAAFERHEREFQKHEDWPGLKSQPVDPPKVLDAQ